MDGVLLSLATDLLKQLGSITVRQAQQEINLIVGVDEEIENLQYNFKMVQAMLSKFEESRLRDDAVKLWYDKLEDVYYMMDDVLDTWKTAKIKLQIQKEEEGEKAAHSNAPAPLEKKMKKELLIYGCPILEQRCKRGVGDYWPNISHIPNIKIDYEYVQKDGQLPDSIDSETKDSNDEEDDGAGFETDEQVEANIDSDDDLERFSTRGGGADSDSDDEAPEAANAEDSSTTARPDAANAGGGSGSARLKTENLNSYARVKIKNSDGTKDGGAQGTGPAGPTVPAGSSMPGIVVKEDATKIFTENIQASGAL